MVAIINFVLCLPLEKENALCLVLERGMNFVGEVCLSAAGK